VRRFAAEEMAKKGIEFRYGITVKEITKLDSGELKLQYSDGTEQMADCVLYATGRVPHVTDLGLENVDVKQKDNGAIIVNGSFQTSVPSIYALGDVTDKVQLTPVALAEGMALVRHLYEAGNPAVDYDLIPTAVFCQPNIGTVGITEEQARDRGFDVDIYRSDFRAMKNTLADNPERTLMKMIVDKATDKVLGIHMAGADAGEIIQGMAVALKAGATKAVFDSTIGIHPTSAEEFVTMREPVKS